MPSTTRYSATFDRPYEEDERQQLSNGMRRSRSQSWQANLGMDSSRPYTPLQNSRPSQRSSSTDSSSTKSIETIPTRTLAKPVVKTHNNPFQFVKIGTSPLYKKAEEQLKKTKEVKKVETVKEEEEEWQSNLDSWKSRRRKMSEDVFRRQEEIKQFELEQQQKQLEDSQKKIKKFSEMVESRQHRGRTLSCCLISSPLDLQKWDLENNNSQNNGTHSYSEGSEENSVVNSEDEEVSGKRVQQSNLINRKAQSTENILSNGITNSKNKFFELGSNCLSPNNGSFLDSGLESISSSHRAGDTPDSCSDFSQDSGSGIDYDSPRVSGLVLNEVNLLGELNLKEFQNLSGDSPSKENVKRSLSNLSADKNELINFQSDNMDKGALVFNAMESRNGTLSSQEQAKNDSLNSHETSSSSSDVFMMGSLHQEHNKSIESENEVFVDDFDEINKHSDPTSCLTPSVKSMASNPDLKDKIDSKSSVPQSGIYAIKVATVVHSSDEGSDEVTDLQGNKCFTSNLSSLSGDSESYNSDDVVVPFSKQKINSFPHADEDNTNVVVKLKKPKRKNIKKKKDSKSSKENAVSPVDEKELNVVFQSKNINPDKSAEKEQPTSSEAREKIVLKDVPPVEQVAEEMERLILQQLEEEERAKEMSMKMPSEGLLDSPEHNLLFRSRSAEPPKEKPPPPPCLENEKSTSLKRVNSTKRIKKEICKRRSNFLGIENDVDTINDELAIPPPPALEQILKAEMELDRESRKRLENATTERLILEENEIRKKEQEIIEIMETEERQKQLISNCDDFSDMKSDCTEVCDIIQERDRIEILKEERKRMEKERIMSEEQRLRLIEEKQLREREELIRKQEDSNSSIAEISAPFSDIAKSHNASNIVSLSPSDTKLNKSNVEVSGEGNGNNASAVVSDQGKSEVSEISNSSLKPVVPPKPFKKKEAIRKERERLRQEQEALVREREEHRRKLKEEEELLKSHQNSHAPDGHVSRIGPLPSLIKPAFAPQLTSPISAQPSTRDNAVVNRNYCPAQNGISKNSVCVESPSHNNNKRNKPIPPPKKTVKCELRNQQKVSSVRKQPNESLSDSKYNQNHWLIQEAEMRRITELKERQRMSQFANPQTHLAEDDVCSVPIRAQVYTPGVQTNNPVKEQIWNYGHSNMAAKKYPPAIGSEKPLPPHYARDVPPAKPSRVSSLDKPSRIVPLERPEQMLSVSGRKRCSHCNEELGRGAAMIIESLQLFYHIHCFQCCVCQAQLGNGSCGADVRVRSNKIHCQNCYSNDEAGLKFSQV